MKITFKVKWWSWKSGQEQIAIALPKTQNGYISKRAWRRFEAAIKDLNGKKVRVEVL